MAEVKWIKITTSMFDDEKIKLIESLPDADSILIVWIKILVQAGRTNASGYIFLNAKIPYTDEMLATIFNRPLNTVRLALKTFKEFGMIEMDESGIHITNWGKHQNIEGLYKIREQTRIRVARHRESKLLTDSNATVTLRNATDLEVDLDLDKNKDLKNTNIESKETKKHIFSLIKKLKDLREQDIYHGTYYDEHTETFPAYQIIQSFSQLPPDQKIGELVKIYMEVFPEQKKLGTNATIKANDTFREALEMPTCNKPEEILKEIVYAEGTSLTPWDIRDKFKGNGYTFTRMKYEMDQAHERGAFSANKMQS